MEFLPLDLVIALGGIATGIGAIWTAGVTRNLARATERSVAEQSQSLREQNERDRINLEVYLKYRMEERFDSELFQNYRLKSLTHVKDTYFVDGDILDVQDLDPATEQIHAFFEDVGYLCRVGVLPVERVWSQYPGITTAWVLWEPAIKKLRDETGDPRWYGNYEYLYNQMVDVERRRGYTDARPTKDDLREFVEENIQYVEIARKQAINGQNHTTG